jgi:hypothetical protein
MNAFVQRHAASIYGCLQGWDRLRLRGSLCWLSHPLGLVKHLARAGLELLDFKAYARSRTIQVGRAAEALAQQRGRPAIYLRSSGTNKEQRAREIAARDGVREGLICTFWALENCLSFRLGKDRSGQWQLFKGPHRCNHYYHYLLHPVFGFMHLRIQSWAPFTLQVGLNGREWLARQLEQAGIGYRRSENCFPWIADLEQAQALANQQVRFVWEPALQALVQELVPGMAQVIAPDRLEYYWTIDESEWAHDTLFRSPEDLAALYPALTRRGIECFGSRQVLKFLGQKVPASGPAYPNDQQEHVTTLKQRPEGTCLKHRLGKNQIKCYDKQHLVFRAEVTINDPRAFKVPRWDEHGEVRWMEMRKGVADARRRAELSQQAAERYLEALAAVEAPTPLKALTAELSRGVRWGKQRVRGLRLLEEQDEKLLAIVGRGEFLINGFRNKDLQQAWFGEASADPQERKRRSGQITRKLRLLRAHGLIQKLPHTHRYLVSEKGRTVIAALLAAGNANIAQLTKAA